MKEITLNMDGRELQAREGQTLLEVALANGIEIPHLCHDSRLTPTGACRLCLVEIEGGRGLQTSCTRLAVDGMTVRTNTDEIRASRKMILELLLSEHRVACTTCDRDGDCTLQDYAYEYQASETRFPSVATAGGEDNYTTGHKGIMYDPSKCVRCQRCVKICADVQMAEALTLKGRALDAVVSTAFDLPLNDSTCETCGQCVSTCPTGSLYARAAAGKGRLKDFRKVRTTCPYCGVGCQLDLNVNKQTGAVVRITSEPGGVPNDGNTCVKGRFGLDFISHAERLRTPLIKEGGEFRAASWDEALALIAKRLAEIKQQHGADALAGLSSAKTTNEENYLLQKFVRAVLGTNNVDHCARLCHASTVAGLARAFGSGAMTNSIEEIGRAPLIFVIGSNTTECHPVIGITIRQAVAFRGAKLIVADPRRISLADIAQIHISQQSGTDVALINAMMHAIIEEGLADREFIAQRTEGYDELAAVVKECPPELAEKITGVPAADIREAARMYARAPSASIIYSMGITQHTTGTDNVKSLANLAMLTGNVGKECSGVNPLRGQNNVQGACDLGALPNVYPGYQKVDDAAVRAKFEQAWGAELSPNPGLTVIEIMTAAEEGKVRGLYIMGENPMLSDPDINHVEECLEALDFLVVQDIFLTETAKLADVVLPATSFAEKDGSFTNTERRVQRVRKTLDPPGEARADWQILCDVATAMNYPMSYNNAGEILDEIASLSPIYGGISFARIDEVGLQWPCTTADHPGTKYLHKDKFTRGRGKFHAVSFLPPKESPDKKYPFILTTGRQLEHFHTGTMSRRSEVLDDLVPHGAVQVHPADAEKLGIANGDLLQVRSRRGEIKVPAEVTDRMRRGTVFLAFHFREHPANALTIAALDPIAKIPEFKVCAVSIAKA